MKDLGYTKIDSNYSIEFFLTIIIFLIPIMESKQIIFIWPSFMYTTRWETMKTQIGQYATILKTVGCILLIVLYQINISSLCGKINMIVSN